MNMQGRWVYILREEAEKTNSRYQPTSTVPSKSMKCLPPILGRTRWSWRMQPHPTTACLRGVRLRAECWLGT